MGKQNAYCISTEIILGSYSQYDYLYTDDNKAHKDGCIQRIFKTIFTCQDFNMEFNNRVTSWIC